MGTGLSTGSDSEVITQILCHPPKPEDPNVEPNWLDRYVDVCSIVHTFILYAPF